MYLACHRKKRNCRRMKFRYNLYTCFAAKLNLTAHTSSLKTYGRLPENISPRALSRHASSIRHTSTTESNRIGVGSKLKVCIACIYHRFLIFRCRFSANPCRRWVEVRFRLARDETINRQTEPEHNTRDQCITHWNLHFVICRSASQNRHSLYLVPSGNTTWPFAWGRALFSAKRHDIAPQNIRITVLNGIWLTKSREVLAD